MKITDVKFAANTLLIIFALFILFHLLVLLGLVPIDMLWGGQLDGESSILVFEAIAILLFILFAFFVALKAGYIKAKSALWGQIGIWIVVIYFALNTLGNLAAVTLREKIIFTPITILITLLALRLGLKKKN